MSQVQASGSGTPVGGAPRKRAQPIEEYVEQEWQKVDTHSTHGDLDWAAAEGEDPEEWECVACRKIFRSEAAWDSHERSKKHMKEVERLKREMLEDEEELGLDRGPEYEPEEPPESPTEEINIMDTPRSPLLATETDSNVQAIPEVTPDPPPSETAEDDGEQPLNKEKKRKKKSSKTLQEPLTRTERKAMKKRQPPDVQHFPSPLGYVNDAPNNSRLNLTRTEATTKIAQLPDARSTVPSPTNPDEGSNSPSVNNDVEHNIPSEHGDFQTDQTSNLPELSKREKRRAREAKKAVAGEKKESPVSLAMYQPFDTVNNFILLVGSMQCVPAAFWKQN